MSFTPVVEIRDGVPGIGVIVQGDSTVAEANAFDPGLLETGFAWGMLDAGTITTGTQPLDVIAGDLIIWTEDDHFIGLTAGVGPQGPPGADGYTVLSGQGAPLSSTGKDGDWYIDIDLYMMYGPKSGTWPAPPFSLVGPPGPQGSPGETVTIVGYFGNVRTPEELPNPPILPIDWDGPGRPPTEVTIANGQGLFYQHPDGPIDPRYGEVWVWYDAFNAWTNIGKIVGPQGEQGIQGVKGDKGDTGIQGPAGETVAVVGYFGDVRTPLELPADGIIPIDWDGPGRPSQQIQMESGWALFYQHPLGPSDPAYGEIYAYSSVEQAWFNIGKVVGPQGEPGETGATGPAGPTVVSADAGNTAVLGSDDFLYVPASGGGGGEGWIIGEIKPFVGDIGTLPQGWFLADGTNGTVNLQGRSLFGAGANGIAFGVGGGALPVAGSSGPGGAHSHTLNITSAGSHGHSISITAEASHGHTISGMSTDSQGAHAHSSNTGSHALVIGEIPSHNHKTHVTSKETGSTTPGTNPRMGVGDEGNVTNGVELTSDSKGGGAGHNHSIESSGLHTHVVDNGTASLAGSHSHTGSSAASGGGHTHPGSATNAVDHSHTIEAGTLPPYFGVYMIQYTGAA